MATTQFGTTLVIGATSIAGYQIDTDEDGDMNVSQEDTHSGTDGTQVNRLVFYRNPIFTLNLVTSGTASLAKTHFPKGLKATHTGMYAGLTLSSCFVNDCKVSNSKGGQKVSVTLEYIATLA